MTSLHAQDDAGRLERVKAWWNATGMLSHKDHTWLLAHAERSIRAEPVEDAVEAAARTMCPELWTHPVEHIDAVWGAKFAEDKREEFRAIALKALRAAALHQGEPVAWRWRPGAIHSTHDNVPFIWTTEPTEAEARKWAKKYSGELEPLYLQPAPPSEKPAGKGGEREVLLFTSYCGDDNPSCSDKKPCPACLGMSNVYRARLISYVRELAPEWNIDRPNSPLFTPSALRSEMPAEKYGRA